MKKINKLELKQMLIKNGYANRPDLETTIERMVNFTGKPQEMLENWMSTGEIISFRPIEGIDINYLRETLKMKDPAIIISYAMLVDNPKVNSVHLKRLADNKIIFQPVK